MKKRVAPIAVLAVFCGLMAAQSQSVPSAKITKHLPPVVSQPTKFHHTLALLSSDAQQPPPTDEFCRINYGFPCYSPQEIQNAYGVTPLLNSGYNGTGQTIVIIDAYGSPTIAQDLHAFDVGFGLPDPPSFTILTPLGTVPFNPNDPWQLAWAGETTGDVEASHSMAPGANIVLLTSPVNETEGVQGLPQFLYLEQYALEHKLGNIISQSWGVTENTLFTPEGQKLIADFEAIYQEAAKENITVLAGTGDTGVANFDINLNYYPFPTVGWPASSPSVTAVGGTTLYADTLGNYQYEIGWGNPYTGASGGGVSQQFAEPSYQFSLPASIQTALNNHRGIPDVAFNGDLLQTYILYIGYLGPQYAGFYPVGGGTSAGSPNWAGIVADLNQQAGHPLGFLNPMLYAMHGESGFLRDIVVGTNAANGLPGYLATPGWDFVTGWGTPYADGLFSGVAKTKD